MQISPEVDEMYLSSLFLGPHGLGVERTIEDGIARACGKTAACSHRGASIACPHHVHVAISRRVACVLAQIFSLHTKLTVSPKGFQAQSEFGAAE